MSDDNSSRANRMVDSTDAAIARTVGSLDRLSLRTDPPKAEPGVGAWSAAVAEQAAARLVALSEMVGSPQSADAVTPFDALVARLLLSDLALTVSFLRATTSSARLELDETAAGLQAALTAIANLTDGPGSG